MHAALGAVGLGLAVTVSTVRVPLALVGLVSFTPAVAFLATSRALERWRVAPGWLAVLDGAPVVVLATIYGVALRGGSDDGARWAEALLMAVIMLRAGVVPSRAWQTALVGVLGFAALYAGLRAVPAFVVLPLPEPAWVSPLAIALVTVAVAARTSRTLHGLEERVRDAEQMGSYRLIEKIGEGGMGTVWRAEHAHLRRPTAVKLMAIDHLDEASARRFDREAQLTASLTHPNTVAVFDYGRSEDGRLYYAMELVDGPSLEALVEEEGALPAARAMPILRQIADALSEAHGAGLVHGDVKPANVLLTRRPDAFDFVKVVDFGLARPIHDGTTSAFKESSATVIRGTPTYLAPEMITGASRPGARADIYSFGALAFFLLTGELVFPGSNLVEICSHHLHTKPRAPSTMPGSEAIPEELESLILRCLAKRPEERPTSMREIVDELAQIENAVAIEREA